MSSAAMPELATATTKFSVTSLPSTWSPPASCLASSAFYEVHTGNTKYYVQGPRDQQTACFPPSYTARPTAFYSPGVCPSRYTPACSFTRSVASLTETHYTCCPDIATFRCGPNSNFANAWQSTLGCVSQYTTKLVAQKMTTVQAGTTTIANNRVTLTPSGTGTLNAFSIHVARQATDSAGSGDGNGGGRDNNKATAIGVGVGVGVALLLLVIGAYLFWKRRKNRQIAAEKAGYAAVDGGAADEGRGEKGAAAKIPEAPVEVPGMAMGGTKPITVEPAELPPDNQVVEVGSSGLHGGQRTPVAEMMGDALPPGSTHAR
ncbi:hypothetical protein F5B20DRAFT_590004 [Whalleya microplaca]|nr:hypothetical protein F5B20DRAFT_590004 [Whalleya microplaca]